MKLSRTVWQGWLVVILMSIVVGAPQVQSKYGLSETSSVAPFKVHLAMVVLQQDNSTDFERLSQDLAAMQEFFSGGNDEPIPEEQPSLLNAIEIASMMEQVEPVAFDVQAARQQGFSDESIQLAQQLATFTNDLVAASRQAQQAEETTSIDSLAIDAAAYPELSAYFEAATTYQQTGATNESLRDTGVKPNTWYQEYVCGSFWRPLPSYGQMASGTQYRRFYNVQDPFRTLSSWGYWASRPGSLTGGGWTRVQNHLPFTCGWFAFRDHAYIYNGNSIVEQNYEGWWPRGEPNPEVYYVRWPYPWWPSYVWWWHIHGPGK